MFEEQNINATETVEATEIVETKIGIVTDCQLLNIRKEPSITSSIMSFVSEGSKLEIELIGDPEWYKIYTETGLEGYCMAKFIRIN